MLVPEPDRIEQTDQRHVYTWDGLGIAITLERFQEERAGLKCEIAVVDTQNDQKLLPTANFNLSSARGQKELIGRLTTRTPDESIPWELILDLVTDRSQERYRLGDAVVDLFDRQPSAKPRFLLPPFIEDGGVTILYGDGGSLKSLMALAMGLSVASGAPLLGVRPIRARPVLYLDWEASVDDHAERAQALWAGADTTMDPPLTFMQYKRQVASLAEGAANASRVIQDLGAGLVIVDSLGMARGGAPEAADVTIAFFRAARSLGVPVLAVDHINQEARKSGDLSSPFGSRYTHNLARRTFSVEKEQEEGASDATIFLTNFKHNNTGKSERTAFRFEFASTETELGDTRLERIEIEPMGFVQAACQTGPLHRMTRKDQIITALREARGFWSVQEIKDWLEAEGVPIGDQVIRNTLKKNAETFVTEPAGASGRANRWGLRAFGSFIDD